VGTTTVGRTGDEVRWSFEARAAVPAEVRRELAARFAEWGLREEEWQGPLLVANELVTNAVEHARTAFDLAVSLADDTVVIEVTDSSPAGLQHRAHDPVARRGRGLQVVDALSRQWSCTGHGTGKTVRAEVPAEAWTDD
jgi:anti-sigma regulatory factor (Ser/Thr protein kinase)